MWEQKLCSGKLDVPNHSKATAADGATRTPGGSQTLLRGLDVLEAVAAGAVGLGELAGKLALTRSTTHRLASALVERGYLTFVPREGYGLGPKLLELGYGARQQMDIPRIARRHLEALADVTADTVHLGVLQDGEVLYLDKIPGQRRIEIKSRVGERQPITSTALGKAMIFEEDEGQWRQYWEADAGTRAPGAKWETWLKRIRTYVQKGHAFDLEENQDRIRCVAAPVREAGGRIVAAISVTGAAQYMNDARLSVVAASVKTTAASISSELGWRTSGDTPGRKRRA
jgi:DNA-binding IclR family transcriptional regulator